MARYRTIRITQANKHKSKSVWVVVRNRESRWSATDKALFWGLKSAIRAQRRLIQIDKEERNGKRI